MSMFAGIDLCAFPSATAPEGAESNFIDPPTYAPTVIAVSTLMMIMATFFTVGRVFANRKHLTWSDYTGVAALVFSLGQGGLMLAQIKFVRHQWDIPACWFFANYPKILYSQQMMLIPGLICSKISLFLLLLHIFQIKGAMKLAIRIGLIATFVINLPSIPIESYYNAPSPGQSWEELMLSGKPRTAIYWGVIQSVLSTLLDAYMFVLPLPVISQLQMPQQRRLKLGLLFSTAFMGVVADVVSLIYRVKEYKNMTDGTWNLYALLLATVVELNIAIIVCSMPGVAKLIKSLPAGRSLLQSLQFKLMSQSLLRGTGSEKKSHEYSDVEQEMFNTQSRVEAFSIIPPAVDPQREEFALGQTRDVEMTAAWEIDPYLDTSGPEYSWLKTSGLGNFKSQ